MIFNLNSGFPPRPTFDITVDGTTYRFDGQTPVSVENKFLMEVKNTADWRLKVLPGVQLTIAVISNNPTKTIDVGLVGKGGNGGSNGYNGNDSSGGGGGGGGEVKTVMSQRFTVGSTYTLNTNGSTYLTGGDLNLTCVNGHGGQGGGNGVYVADGGSSGGNSGSGGDGAYSGTNWQGGGSGGDGVYVFSSDFDSTLYGAGGAGGHAYQYGGGGNGSGYGNPGSGGRGHGDSAVWPDDGHGGWNGIIWLKTSTW